MPKILFVLTGTDFWTLADGTKHPTGFWAEEAAAPYEAFTAAGYEVVVATPGGVVPTVDKSSLAPEFNGGQEGADKVAALVESLTELQHPIRIEDVDLAEYAAVFYPGGHGPMEDLAVDAASGRLLIDALGSGKPLAVVCHGPAALLAATKDDGSNAFMRLQGHRVHQRRGDPVRFRRQGEVAPGDPPGRGRLSTSRSASRGSRRSSSTATSSPARTRPRPPRSRTAS